MTIDLQHDEDRQQHKWTREEMRKINARMRRTRRRVWWHDHRGDLLFIAFVGLGIAAVALAVLVKVN
jgi:hypothetical protein